MFGPAFGPLLGGVFAETLGWRSIFWFLTIATGVILVPLTLSVAFCQLLRVAIADAIPSFMPETLRSLVGDGSIPPPPLNMSPPMLWQYRKVRRHHEKYGEEQEKVERPPHKPVSSLKRKSIHLQSVSRS